MDSTKENTNLTFNRSLTVSTGIWTFQLYAAGFLKAFDKVVKNIYRLS